MSGQYIENGQLNDQQEPNIENQFKLTKIKVENELTIMHELDQVETITAPSIIKNEPGMSIDNQFTKDIKQECTNKCNEDDGMSIYNQFLKKIKLENQEESQDRWYYEDGTSINNQFPEEIKPENQDKPHKPAKTDHQCKICSKFYSNLYCLSVHIKNLHPDSYKAPVITCKICKRKFILKSALELHMKNKHFDGKSERFECDLCGKIFNNKTSIASHIQTHQARVQCPVCNAQIKPKGMRAHMIDVHATGCRYQCTMCPKSFKALSLLKCHKTSHIKPFECDTCGKAFTRRRDIKNHKKFHHENPESFSCQLCGKKFNEKFILKVHQKVHDKNRPRPYKCYECDYATDVEKTFRAHQARHEKDHEKFKTTTPCTLCGKYYRDKHVLRVHMKIVHPEKLLQCDLCGTFAKAKSTLRKHFEMHLRKIEKLRKWKAEKIENFNNGIDVVWL